MLYALPTRACDVTEAGNELLDERGLADSRLAGDPDDGALPATGAVPRVPEAREFPQAADEVCGVRFTGGALSAAGELPRACAAATDSAVVTAMKR